MRGAPRVGFSETIWKIKARTCAWRIVILQATGHVTMLRPTAVCCHFKGGLNSGEAQRADKFFPEDWETLTDASLRV
jgi:hypothetical protein